MASKSKTKTTSKAAKAKPAPVQVVATQDVAARRQLKKVKAALVRLDAFVDAIRPMLPSEALDEADALKAAIGDLTDG